MIKKKYKLSKEEMLKYEEYFSKMKDYTISPALVQNWCFKYRKEEIEEMMKEMMKEMSK